MISEAIMNVASNEAARLNHEFVGTEHLLLAVCIVAQGELVDAGFNPNKVHGDVERIVNEGTPVSLAERRYPTPVALRVAESAFDASPRSLIAALILEKDSVASQVLRNQK